MKPPDTSGLKPSQWRELLELAEQAQELDPEAHQPWLDGLRLDPAAHQVLLHLLSERAAVETQDFLGRLPTALADAPSTTGRPVAGQMVGPWRLLQPLGEGGMSSVWLAERADEQVQRQVALKLPHAGPGQDVLAARLLRERNILAGLEHRNIARLYDVGLSDSGLPYLVMEHVQGRSLLEHADAQQLTLRQRLALFQQVLRAVQYAHGKLVLHRDLKPSNILVNEAGDVKLLDFGIAKPLQLDSPNTELTQAMGRHLTPGYASPEQWRGEALGTTSDIYALGIVFYELLVGKHPFQQHLMGRASATVSLPWEDLPPPSKCAPPDAAARQRGLDPVGLRRALRGDLDTLCLKALAPQAEQRYASAEAFNADISRWLAGEPLSIRPPSAGYLLSKLVRRHPWATALGSLSVLALTSVSLVATTLGLQAREEAVRAQSAYRFMTDLFESADHDANTDQTVSASDILRASVAKLRAVKTAQDRHLAIELLSGIALGQRRLGDYEGAADTTLQRLNYLSTDEHATDRVMALLDLCIDHVDLGKYQEARLYLRQALEESSQAEPSRRLYIQMSGAAGYLAQHTQQLTLAQQALQVYLELAAESPEDVAPETLMQTHLDMAQIETLRQQSESARRHLAAAERLAHAHARDVPWARFNPVAIYRVNIEMNEGRYAHTVAWLAPTVSACAEAMGASSATCSMLRAELMAAYQKMGHIDLAVQTKPPLHSLDRSKVTPTFFRDILASLAKLAGMQAAPVDQEDLVALAQAAQAAAENSVDASLELPLFNALAEAHLWAARSQEAKPWVQRARQLLQQHPGLSASREALKTGLYEGLILHGQGRYREALAAMGPICQPSWLNTPTPHRVLTHLNSLNCVPTLAALQRKDDAAALLHAALPALEQAMGADSPVMQRVLALKAHLDKGPIAPTKPPSTQPFF